MIIVWCELSFNFFKFINAVFVVDLQEEKVIRVNSDLKSGL